MPASHIILIHICRNICAWPLGINWVAGAGSCNKKEVQEAIGISLIILWRGIHSLISDNRRRGWWSVEENFSSLYLIVFAFYFIFLFILILFFHLFYLFFYLLFNFYLYFFFIFYLYLIFHLLFSFYLFLIIVKKMSGICSITDQHTHTLTPYTSSHQDTPMPTHTHTPTQTPDTQSLFPVLVLLFPSLVRMNNYTTKEV